MSHDEEPSGITAVATDIVADPGDRLGHVLDVHRMLDRGRESIIEGDEDVSLTPKLLRLGSHLGALVSFDVAPAVNENDDRMLSAEPGRIDVERGERVG